MGKIKGIFGPGLTDRLAMSDEAKLNWLAISDVSQSHGSEHTIHGVLISHHHQNRYTYRGNGFTPYLVCNTLLKIFCIYNHTFVSTSLRERAKNMVGVANTHQTTRMTQLSKMISSTLLHFSCCNQVLCLAVPLSLDASGFSFPTSDSPFFLVSETIWMYI